MTAINRSWAIVLGLAMTTAACGTQPRAEIDAARTAVERANADNAPQYASDSWKAAQDAQALLDAELQAQERAWFKSYERSRELAVATKTAAERAATEAATAKEAEVVAAREVEAAAARARAATVASTRTTARSTDPVKIKDVQPVYPAIAQNARVTGTVTIEATVGPNGRVTKAEVVRSVPLLDQAALDAVRQWEYRPSTLNGRPVPAVVTVTVNFVRS